MKGVIELKKDRNCGMGGYNGMIPNYGMVMPGGVIPMPGMMNYPNFNSVPDGINGNYNNYNSSDLSSLSNKVNSLEQRVNRLENLVSNGTYSNSYNSSNYQMM